MIDLATEQPIAFIDGLKGVHGIAIVNELNKGFISDGKRTAVGIIYDPYSKKVFVFNGDSKNTCVIDINTLELVKTIDLGGGPEFAVSADKELMFSNIEDKSSLKVIDTKTLPVKATYPLSPCGGPTGIAI